MAKILLADDDAASLEFMKRSLTGDGHDVSTVQDGLDAWDRLVDNEGRGVEILITDIEMPGLDGIELAKRALAQNPNLKILLVSGFATGVDRANSVTGPNVLALNKPLTLEQIRTAVKSLAR